MQAMLATIPMGRTGTPHECVGTILFLASDGMSSYVTGQIIEVNGGQLTP
jgi:3-oxoacyl-[acyl-carrier protein] reductase